jgi:hypothetical protein
MLAFQRQMSLELNVKAKNVMKDLNSYVLQSLYMKPQSQSQMQNSSHVLNPNPFSI